MSLSRDLSETVLRDLVSLVAGDPLGGGISRKVYVFEPDPSLVIKFEDSGRSFQNVAEYQLWQDLLHTPFAKWFAPVVQISYCGSVLLMKRTEPMQRDQYPDKVPSAFMDRKRSNFGMLDGRLVCHDYGVNASTMAVNAMNNRLIKADWWDQ